MSKKKSIQVFRVTLRSLISVTERQSEKASVSYCQLPFGNIVNNGINVELRQLHIGIIDLLKRGNNGGEKI